MYYETKEKMLLEKAVFYKQIERNLLILYDQLKKYYPNLHIQRKSSMKKS